MSLKALSRLWFGEQGGTQPDAAGSLSRGGICRGEYSKGENYVYRKTSRNLPGVNWRFLNINYHHVTLYYLTPCFTILFSTPRLVLFASTVLPLQMHGTTIKFRLQTLRQGL